MKKINKFQWRLDKHSMRYTLFSVFFFVVFESNGRDLFVYHPSSILSEKQKEYCKAWTKNVWVQNYWYITITEDLKSKNELLLNLPGNTYIAVERDNYQIIDKAISYWYGSYNNGGSANFVINEKMLTGRFADLKQTFMLYPISDGVHILLECDLSKSQQDESPEGYKQMIHKGMEYQMNNTLNAIKTNREHSNESIVGDCSVRVMVIFTDDVYNALADVIGFTHSCITTSNSCYFNSAINFQLELAVSKKQVYAESGNSSTDVARFRSTNDGYMDDVHFYRDDFDADLCVLIVETLNNACGEAAVVANSSFADAFCVVARGCATSSLTFPHELGHLYGCRHDTYVDNNNTPYSYGHGYVNLTNQWRTVMAYNDQCVDNGTSCSRIPYFSNPVINYGGNPTGTIATNNNAWATVNSRTNISSLQTTDYNKTFVGSQLFFEDDYFDAFGANTVFNSTNFTMNVGASGVMRAGSEIILNPGFLALTGCNFIAYTDWCTPLRTSETFNQHLPKHFQGLSVYPNPASDFITININNADSKSTFQIFNSTMQLIKSIDNIEGYETTIDVSNMPNGIYFIQARANDETFSQKLIVHH